MLNKKCNFSEFYNNYMLIQPFVLKFSNKKENLNEIDIKNKVNTNNIQLEETKNI